SRLSAAELGLPAASFRKLDTDGSQALSPAEWAAGAPELARYFSPQAPQAGAVQADGLGLIGGIGAGIIGLGLAGYLAYAGRVGSGQLMHPEKDSYANPPAAYGIASERVTFQSHDG